MHADDAQPASLEYFAKLVPRKLLGCSGEVFYSGRAAFSDSSDVYLLGYNPGSDSADPRLNTVETGIDQVHSREDDRFSSYYQPWEEGRDPKMQRGIKHLFANTGLDPCRTPSSNRVFVRSRGAKDLDTRKRRELEEACWPFHKAVILKLDVRIILCMGNDAFNSVSKRMGVSGKTPPIDEFIEENHRRWSSQAYETMSGIFVVKLTHPSRAHWYFRSTDPSPLVRRMLARVKQAGLE